MSEPTLNFMIQTHQVNFAVPNELLKKNLKAIQKLIEKARKLLMDETAKIELSSISPEQKLAAVRKLIKSFEQTQRKLKMLVESDSDIRRRLTARAARMAHLRQYTIKPKDGAESDDLQLDFHNEDLIGWLRDEANLLIIDYLLKSNLNHTRNTGVAVAEKLGKNAKLPLADLIDIDVYENFNQVFLSITEKHDLELITAWYTDNRNALKKIGLNLQFEIHYCKYLLLLSKGEVHEAVAYSKLHLAAYARKSNYSIEEEANFLLNSDRLIELGASLTSSAGFLQVIAPGNILFSILSKNGKPSHNNKLLSSRRGKMELGWTRLANCFTEDYTRIYGITHTYPLLVYLSAGLSCLKTKSCFCYRSNTIFKADSEDNDKPKKHRSSKDLIFRGPNFYYDKLKKINQCPVCSPELYALSRSLPYGLLITSIFNDPFMLPNGNIYPFNKLLAHRGLDKCKGRVYDPLTKEKFLVDDCVRVFPA